LQRREDHQAASSAKLADGWWEEGEKRKERGEEVLIRKGRRGSVFVGKNCFSSIPEQRFLGGGKRGAGGGDRRRKGREEGRPGRLRS